MSATDQSALFITGASAGIGAAVAQRFLDEGWRVWGTARDLSRLKGLSAHTNFHPVVLDLSDRDGALAAYHEAAEASGGFAVVVNNAGYGHFGAFTEDESGDALLAAMVNHTTALVRAQLRSLAAQGQGTLVNVSSLATEFPLPFMSGYNMAKAALSALSETLMQEFRGTGIRVIDFRPGDVNTGFNQAMSPPDGYNGTADQAAAWTALEANVASAPPPAQIAADLWRAVQRGRSGIVRSGGFFQTRLAPRLIRLAPSGLARRIRWRYFGLK